MKIELVEHIGNLFCHSLVVPDEVVLDVARITLLVKKSPVLIEWSRCSRVDYVLNEFVERDSTAVWHCAILVFDLMSN